ncbi:hypothetical protein JTE90_005431 [Oedothorax gibbosus]|uniref:Uncharacterized protein n=1 Tax=Oedothorax gibbosus TaxID=931172 RepID=A0AAV6TEL2_9ARAC|nr:hypothetical protein JTE90_005431 [Oedothorax gibbosus]
MPRQDLNPTSPRPHSQSLSRSYGSNFPTSLTYIVLGQQRRTGHRKRRGAFTRSSVPISGRADSRDTNSYKEKDNSSRVLRRRLRVRLRYRTWSRRTYLRVRVGEILTPFPFGRQRDKHEHVFAFRQTSRFGTDFSDPLGPTDPCSTAVHMEPFSSFSPQGSHLSIWATYHQDLHRWRLQAGSRPAPSTHATGDPPTHCGVNLHEGSSAVAARYRPNAGASSISGLVASVGELLHTP